MKTLVPILAAVCAIAAAASPAAVAPLDTGKALLNETTNRFFENDGDLATLRVLLDDGLAAFAQLNEAAERAYWQARVHYVYGMLERGAGATPAAEKHFTTSLQLLDTAVLEGSIPDSWRLMADDYAQLMIVNGILYAAITGWKVKNLADKALAAEPGNAKARLTLCLYAMNAPGFAGGSIDAAIDGLLSLSRRDDLEREDRFAVYMWLGIAQRKKRHPEAATPWFQKAQTVYPGNTWIRDIEAGPG